MILDRPQIGVNYRGPGTLIRTSDNNQQWPGTNCGNDDYCRSQSLSGSLWHTRELAKQVLGPDAGPALVDRLFHEAKMARPNDQARYFDEFLNADDNDGDLSNGTPHYDIICQGFGRHGFECPEVESGVSILHLPLGNTSDTANGYLVEAEVTSTEGAIMAGTVHLVYRLNGGAYTTVVMTPLSTPDRYQYVIPAQSLGTMVEYYLSAEDQFGNRGTHPERAPANVHSFLVADVVYFNDFERTSDEGWTHAQVRTQDDWHHDEPTGVSQHDPEHAFSGRLVWGNDLGGWRGSSYWDGDYKSNVENYLLSPSIDCSGRQGVRLVYQRWLTVEDAAYDQATIEVNGQEVWRNAVGDHHLDDSWVRHEIDISAIADDNPDVRVKFTLTSDRGLEFGGWNIDDFGLLAMGVSGQTPTALPTFTPAPSGTPTPTAPPTITPTATPTATYDPGDTTPPHVENPLPAPDETGVPVRPYISLHLVDDNPGVDDQSIVLSVQGTVVQHATLGHPHDYIVSYFPQDDFAPGEVVHITVEAADLLGNVMSPYSYSFTITTAGPETPTPGATETLTPLPSATPAPVHPTPPEIIREPPYTAGTTNEVSWRRIDARATEFHAVISEDQSFSTTFDNSGWISGLKTTFSGLADGGTYYYRVKSRSAPGYESDWSNVTWSTQDDTPPAVLMAGYWNTTLQTDTESMMTILALITDNNTQQVNVNYAGTYLGLQLNDSGLHGDAQGGDGVFTLQMMLPAVSSPGGFLLELETTDTVGHVSTWPYLVVE
jgi:hypothetical protein